MKTQLASSILISACIAALGPFGGIAHAQSADTPPTSQPAPPPSSLDDLLKIKGEQPKAADANKPAQGAKQEDKPGDTAASDARREVEKQLNEAEVADAFVQAVEQMTVAADLLDVKFDAGLNTQRVQEDIIAKLNRLLDQAKKSKSSSKSSSSSSSRQQSKQQNPGQKPQDQNKSQGDQQRNQNPANNRSEMDPPSQQDANANTMIDETRTEWGNLPQRLREQLLQGRKDHPSALYKRLTDEYYKRLAEENNSP